jgi:hypothetical protein
MRLSLGLAALIFGLGAGGAEAQFGGAFEPYSGAATSGYLFSGDNAGHCASSPYASHDARRGQRSKDASAASADPACAGR